MALTPSQAAKRLNRTERTIRRWIEQGRLTAYHPTHGRKDTFLIEESEVARALSELEQVEQPAAEDTAALSERMAQLERRVHHLEQLVSDASPLSLQRATAPFKRVGRPVETPVELPRGSLLMRAFAEQHNVNARTFYDQVVKGIHGEQVEATERPKPSRPGERERWLTPEQQRAAIAFWQRHAVTFTPCAHCPHESRESEDNQETTTLWQEQEPASS